MGSVAAGLNAPAGQKPASQLEERHFLFCSAQCGTAGACIHLQSVPSVALGGNPGLERADQYLGAMRMVRKGRLKTYCAGFELLKRPELHVKAMDVGNEQCLGTGHLVATQLPQSN